VAGLIGDGSDWQNIQRANVLWWWLAWTGIGQVLCGAQVWGQAGHRPCHKASHGASFGGMAAVLE